MSRMENTNPRKEVFAVVPGKNDDGTSVFSVLVKRTYDIVAGGRVQPAEQTMPLIKVDVYYDDGYPESSTVKFENELAAFKLATDVVLVGKAYAPGGKPRAEFQISLEVGNLKKTIQVMGDRHCVYRANRAPLVTDPVEFTEMEIRYERAYGGTYLRNDPTNMFAYPRNPMGTGFVLSNTHETVDGLALPNFEDPNDLLVPERVVLNDPYQWNGQPLPQGLGWYQRTWYPRCSFVGAVPGFVEPDMVMREEKLGLVPKKQIALARQLKLPSFDVRFNNGASIGLALPYLVGGERMRLNNLTLEGELEFTLPSERPVITLDIGLGENKLAAVLHTVCIRAEDRQLDMVWRGAHKYPGVDWLPEMKKMVATVF